MEMMAKDMMTKTLLLKKSFPPLVPPWQRSFGWNSTRNSGSTRCCRSRGMISWSMICRTSKSEKPDSDQQKNSDNCIPNNPYKKPTTCGWGWMRVECVSTMCDEVRQLLLLVNFPTFLDFPTLLTWKSLFVNLFTFYNFIVELWYIIESHHFYVIFFQIVLFRCL